METKVAFITGASTGIGRELALRLAAEGYELGLAARRQNLLEDLGNELAAKGHKAAIYPCDVRDHEAIEQAVHDCEAELGPIDLLVANAGVAGDLSVKNFDVAKARQIYEVNVIGLMQTVAAVLPSMIKRRSGHIVGISSLASYTSFPRNYVYCASKAAVNAHLEGLRLELLPYGVHVTVICPGFIKTPMTADVRFPMPFLMPVEAAVERILKAIEQKKAKFNFPLPLYLMTRLAAHLPSRLRQGKAPASKTDT